MTPVPSNRPVSAFQPKFGRWADYAGTKKDTFEIDIKVAERLTDNLRPSTAPQQPGAPPSRKRIQKEKFMKMHPFIPTVISVGAGGRMQGALQGMAPLPKEMMVFSRPQPNFGSNPKVPRFMVPREEQYKFVPAYLRNADGTWDLSAMCDPPKLLPFENERCVKAGLLCIPGEFGFEKRWPCATRDFTWPELPKDCRRNHPCWSLQYGLSPQYQVFPSSVAPPSDFGGC